MTNYIIWHGFWQSQLCQVGNNNPKLFEKWIRSSKIDMRFDFPKIILHYFFVFWNHNESKSNSDLIKLAKISGQHLRACGSYVLMLLSIYWNWQGNMVFQKFEFHRLNSAVVHIHIKLWKSLSHIFISFEKIQELVEPHMHISMASTRWIMIGE